MTGLAPTPKVGDGGAAPGRGTFRPAGRHPGCPRAPRRLVARTTERYTAVRQLLCEGKSLAAIGRWVSAGSNSTSSADASFTAHDPADVTNP